MRYNERFFGKFQLRWLRNLLNFYHNTVIMRKGITALSKKACAYIKHESNFLMESSLKHFPLSFEMVCVWIKCTSKDCVYIIIFFCFCYAEGICCSTGKYLFIFSFIVWSNLCFSINVKEKNILF